MGELNAPAPDQNLSNNATIDNGAGATAALNEDEAETLKDGYVAYQPIEADLSTEEMETEEQNGTGNGHSAAAQEGQLEVSYEFETMDLPELVDIVEPGAPAAHMAPNLVAGDVERIPTPGLTDDEENEENSLSSSGEDDEGAGGSGAGSENLKETKRKRSENMRANENIEKFSSLMKTAIIRLPLPEALKTYMNYYRSVLDDEENLNLL